MLAVSDLLKGIWTMIHIRDRLHLVIESLRENKFSGVPLKIYPEYEEDWNENYGCVTFCTDQYFSDPDYWLDLLDYFKREFPDAQCKQYCGNYWEIEIFRNNGVPY
jgi:hypothetical protein